MCHISVQYNADEVNTKIKFVGKAMQESVREIKFNVWGRRIKHLTCNLMHKFENASMLLYGFVIFLNLESS